MKLSYRVRVMALKTNRRPRGTTYTVRWTVEGRDFQRTFATKALAESERARIIRSQRAGAAFDQASGLPESEARKQDERAWLTLAVEFVDSRWPHWSSNHRRNTAEALTDVTLAFVSVDRGRPTDDELRDALYGWAFSKAQRNAGQMPANIRATLDWLARSTPDVRTLDDAAVVRRALDAISLRRDGTPAAASTVARKRAALSAVLGYAVELRLLDTHPLKRVTWRAARHTDVVDRRTVVNPDQASALLLAVRDIAPEFEAFFGCLYYAALRPEEALHLRRQDYRRPDVPGGWGWFTLNGATVATSERWSGQSAPIEDRGLKHRAAKDSRPVPVAPPLAELLDAHLTTFGTSRDDRLFTTRRGPGGRYRPTLGQPFSSSAYGRVWQKARARALTVEQQASPLARRPYDLRHAAVSLWLNAGVPATQVAEWAGHSVAVLLRVYAACLDGAENDAIRRVGLALSEPGAKTRPQNAPV